MSVDSGDLRRLVSSAAPLGRSINDILAWGTKHTGLPAIIVAAILLVASFRMARHAARFAFQVFVVAAVLTAATRLGWLRW